MSYTPIGWQTGDTITAEKLNKMDPGWSADTATQTLFNDSVTTESSEYGNEAEVSMTLITADTITVTFGGIEYTATKLVIGNAFGYGGVDAEWNYDFTEYPFAIVSAPGNTVFATETAGTFSFKIDADVTTYDVSTAFTKIINSLVPVFRAYANTTTWQEVHDAVKAGKIVYIINDTEIDNNELSVQIVTRVFIAENTGNYCVEATTQLSGSQVDIANYSASTANSPIVPN